MYSDDYFCLLDSVLRRGHRGTNARTGAGVSTLRGTQTICYVPTDGARPRIPVPGNRVVRPHIAAAEAAWFLRGEDSVAWLSGHTTIWDAFASEEGLVGAAYGRRLRRHFLGVDGSGADTRVDQVAMAVEALRADPSDRQCVLTLWDPVEDGLGRRAPWNVPCPTQVAVNVVDGRTQLSVLMRSSDLFVGLPYDVMTFTVLGWLVGRAVGAPLGEVHMTLANAHLYDVHQTPARASVNDYPECCVADDASIQLRDEMLWLASDTTLHELDADDAADDFVSAVKLAVASAGGYEAVSGTAFDPKPRAVR